MYWPWFAGLGAAGVALAIVRYQGLVIYPSNFPEGSRSNVDNPEAYGMPYDDVYITTRDGEKLHTYVLLRKAKDAGPSPKTVLMFGPNAGNMGHSLPLVQLFYDSMGYNVITVSYRGYGKSTGRPSERGIKRDIDAVLEYVNLHESLKDTSVVLYGRSLGGAAAIYAASTPLGKRLLSGMIVENTFLSISRLIPSVMPVAQPVKFLLTERWESDKTIRELDPDMPALFLAGGRDELIPPHHFRALYDLCPCKQKFYKSYERGTHNDTVMQEGYWQDTHSFLLRYIKPETV